MLQYRWQFMTLLKNGRVVAGPYSHFKFYVMEIVSPKIPPILELSGLIGEWDVEISAMSFRSDPSEKVQGRVSFKWLREEAFIIQHSEFPGTEFPTSSSVIGPDDTNEKYCMLYSDSRGVSRIYEMSLNNGLWKLWRNSAKFSQRFTGKLSDDGNLITAQWEKSEDGSNWKHDFDLRYTKAE